MITAAKSVLGWGFLALVLGTLTATEACYFLGDDSSIKRLAALAWIVISAGFLIVVALRSLGLLLQGEFWRDKDRGWYGLALVLPFCLVYFGVTGITWTPINDEGAQEIAQGVALLKHDPDFGVYRTAYFVGYIARQYLLAGLPTYFFGPSLLALRIGTSCIYLTGYISFLAALAHFFRVKGESNPLKLASFAGMMVSLGEYPIIQARVFEQTTMPLGAMLLFLAGVLYFLSEPTPFRIFWVAWTFGFFVEGYTPALGGWGLALVVLLYLALHPRQKHRLLIIPLVYGICCVAVALLVLGAGKLHDRLQVGSADGLMPSDWAWRYFVGYHTFLSGGSSVIPYPLALACLATLYFSFRFRDFKFPLVCLWALGMALTSITFVGSNFNLPQFDIHRSMMAIPVLAAGVVLFYHAFSDRLSVTSGGHRVLMTIAGFCMAYMVWTSIAVPLTNRTYVYPRDVTDYDEALYKIDCTNYQKPGSIKKIYLVPPLRIDDLETGLGYFAPEAVVVRAEPPPGEKGAGAYLLSYLPPNTTTPTKDPIIPSKRPRPYLELKGE
jgi:hypothetical protein